MTVPRDTRPQGRPEPGTNDRADAWPLEYAAVLPGAPRARPADAPLRPRKDRGK